MSRTLTFFSLFTIFLVCGLSQDGQMPVEIPLKLNEDSELELETDADATYFLESSSNLTDWTFAGPYEIGDGLPRQEQLNQDEQKLFFRYRAYPTNVDNPDDTDDDGLSNGFELQNEFDPIDNDQDNNGTVDGSDDFDGDGSSNSSEESGGSDPNDTSDGPASDRDGDGLTNTEEALIGTNPSKYDSDGDGTSDYYEDADGDGRSNGLDGWPKVEELAPKKLSNTSYAVLPLDFDTHNDKISYINNFSVNNNGFITIEFVDESGAYDASYSFYSDGETMSAPHTYANFRGLNDNDYFFGLGEFYNSGMETEQGFVSEAGSVKYFLHDIDYSDAIDDDVFFESIESKVLLSNGDHLIGGYFNSTYNDVYEIFALFDANGFISKHLQQEDSGASVVDSNKHDVILGYLFWERALGYFPNSNPSSFQELSFPGAVNIGTGYGRSGSFRVNNRNTIIAQHAWNNEVTYLWFDSQINKFYNNEPAGEPSYGAPLIWDSSLGDAPPPNLNTQLTGFEKGTSNLWQNCQWQKVETSGYTDIQIHDINDHGILAAQVTDEATGGNKAALLYPVNLEVEYIESTLNSTVEDSEPGGIIPLERIVEGENRAPQMGLILHELNIPNVKFRLKFNSGGKYEIYEDYLGQDKVISEQTEFNATQVTKLNVQGKNLSSALGAEEITMQVKVGDSDWMDGDSIKATVAQVEFQVDVRNFIPYNWVDVPAPGYYDIVAEGDDRTFDETLPAGKYRIAQREIYNPYPQYAPTVNNQLVETEWKYAGQTAHYYEEDVVNFDDSVKHSGQLTNSYIDHSATPKQFGYATLDEVQTSIDTDLTTDTELHVNFEGSAKEPIIHPHSEPIDWDITIAISIQDPLNPGYVVRGKQDGFPAYEFYINANHPVLPVTKVYTYEPPNDRGVLSLVPITLHDIFSGGDFGL